MSLHRNLTGNELHSIQAFTYADASARLAAIGFTSADIGKVALQLDTKSFWILTDPTPLWSETTGTTSQSISNIITVGKGGAVDFTNIADAVNFVTAQMPALINPWIITVYPGVYIENNPISIPTGVALGTPSQQNRGSAIVQPVNPLEDLFIVNGGSLSGFNLEGVTDAAKSLIRLDNAGVISTIHACSITNCFKGIIIENGAIGLISYLIGQVTLPNSAINNAVHVMGAASRLFMTNAVFTVPTSILSSYVGNPIECCVHSMDGSITNIIGSTFQVVANNTNQTSVLVTGINSIARILGCNFDGDGYGGNIAIKIASDGYNAIVDIQSSTIFNYATNFVIESSTGSIFEQIGTDDIKNSTVPGSTITGIISRKIDKSTDFYGLTQYVYPSFRQTSVGEFFLDQSSSGLEAGSGVVTVTSGLNVHVSDGYGWVHRINEEDVADVYWNATTLLLTANTINFIFYNGSTLSIDSSIFGTNSNNINLATVYTDSSNIRFIHNTSNLVVATDQILHQYLLSTRKFALNKGLAASAGSTATKLTVDVGTYYIATTLISFPGATDATFSYFYNNGATEVASQTNVNITQYDNAGTLTTMTDGYFRTDTLYLTSDGRLSLIYGKIQYSDATSAGLAPIAVAPTFIEPSGFVLSNIIVQKNIGISAFVDLRPRPGIAISAGGASSGITDHGLLSGLLDDDHTQYLLSNGSRSMSGNLNMGGNSVTNANLVDGVNISAHGSRHNPGQVDAIAIAAPITILVGVAIDTGSAASVARSDHQHGIGAGIPVTVSAANSAGIASTVSRSDHVHAHGALLGGATHALAIPDPGGSAGYISSLDQQKLNGIATGATNTVLTNTIPVNVTKSIATVGTSTEAARQDHKHDITTAIAQTIAETNLEGTATSLARSDHIHAHGALAGGTDHALVIADPGGTAGFISSADKQKLDSVASGATNTPLTNTTPVNITKAAAAVGVSIQAARQDHKHDISTAAVVAIGIANTEGTAATIARSDHVHRGVLLQTIFAEISADTTTTSATFVDLISQSITTTGGNLIIQFTTSASNTNIGKLITFRITVDAVAKRGTQINPGAPNAAESAAINIKVIGLSAGVHTIAIQWKRDANTARIAPVTAPDSEHASLIISEVML